MPYVILLFALFASLFTLSKFALNYSEPFFLIGSRMLVAGLILLAYEYTLGSRRANARHQRHHPSEPIAPTGWGALFMLGLINIYITNIAEIWGLQYMSSSKACLIYSLSPFVAALVGYLVLRETLNAKKWLGLLIGFAGMLPILAIDQATDKLTTGLLSVSKSELALLTAVFASVYGWILLKKVIQDYRHSPMFANGVAMTFGGMLALVHSYVTGEAWQPLPIDSAHVMHFIATTMLMMLISNLICYNLYGYLLKRFSATFMSLAGLITPIFASLFGWFFLGETITWHYFVSMAIFSTGLFLFYQEELVVKEQQYAKAAGTS